jgi:ferredoxin
LDQACIWHLEDVNPAPKEFVVDKSKHINPEARVQSEAADTLDRIVMAAQACPTKAIRIIDRYTGNHISLKKGNIIY